MQAPPIHAAPIPPLAESLQLHMPSFLTPQIAISCALGSPLSLDCLHARFSRRIALLASGTSTSISTTSGSTYVQSELAILFGILSEHDFFCKRVLPASYLTSNQITSNVISIPKEGCLYHASTYCMTSDVNLLKPPG